MERSDKHGARVDDEMARELTDLTRSGHTSRDGDSRDPEPAGDDQPAVDRIPEGADLGGIPRGTTAADLELRSELAARLGKEIWPADRAAIISVLEEESAPDVLRDAVVRLPDDRTFVNIQDVALALGLHTEESRF
jgi:hypothetical protein